jgi:hypothetical protein
VHDLLTQAELNTTFISTPCMSKPNHLPALVPASGGTLTTTTTSTQRIATRMADDLLATVALCRKNDLAEQRRYSIGKYEFRETDYQKIQHWARILGMTVEDVVAEFQSVSAWITRVEQVNFDDQSSTAIAHFDFTFDKETYAHAKPIFIQAIVGLKDTGTDIRETMRTVTQMAIDKYGTETATNMQPYIVHFVNDVRNSSILQKEFNVSDFNSCLERDNEKSASKPDVSDIIRDGITLTIFHIESGTRTFASYARVMIDELGNGVKPYLKSWYMAVKHDPGAAGFTGMDGIAAVESANIDTLVAQGTSNTANPNADMEQDRTEPAPGRAMENPVPPNFRGTPDATEKAV